MSEPTRSSPSVIVFRPVAPPPLPPSSSPHPATTSVPATASTAIRGHLVNMVSTALLWSRLVEKTFILDYARNRRDERPTLDPMSQDGVQPGMPYLDALRAYAARSPGR